MWSRELASPGCKWSFLPAFAVLFGVRAVSAVASREETRESGEDCTAARFPFFLFSAPGVKAQRNLQRPPGPAQTGLQLSARLSPFSPGAPRTLGAGGGLAGRRGRSQRRHGEVPEGRPRRCRSCVTLPLFNGPVSVH